ncbi:MAG: ATP-binding protein, partial [Chlorobi bacterium]|nr:ATP-binding protein [Chlorobiota bacterium]
RAWKNLVKGIFDKYKEKYNIIVTGSARMNIYRRGGDSLLGRYFYYTLFPFSLAELNSNKNEFDPFGELNFSDANLSDALDTLYKFGGFPEPLLKQNVRFLRRWQNEKLERLFREDIRDVENIRDLSSMKLLGDMLPQKVASPLSVNALREDLEVSHRAVNNWLSILEAFYYHFRIYPFHSKKIRSLKKEPKLYLFDWSEIENEGARFENLIAMHLKKFVHFLNEVEGYKAELNYLKNVDKKEVDFLVSVKNKPWFAVEVKLTERKPSPNLFYYGERLKIPFCFQVVKTEKIDILRDDVRIISADKFLSGLV